MKKYIKDFVVAASVGLLFQYPKSLEEAHYYED